MDDELFVRDSHSETQHAIFFPVPTLTSSSMHTLSQEQLDMVQAFATQSEMKLVCSQK